MYTRLYIQLLYNSLRESLVGRRTRASKTRITRLYIDANTHTHTHTHVVSVNGLACSACLSRLSAQYTRMYLQEMHDVYRKTITTTRRGEKVVKLRGKSWPRHGG